MMKNFISMTPECSYTIVTSDFLYYLALYFCVGPLANYASGPRDKARLIFYS